MVRKAECLDMEKLEGGNGPAKVYPVVTEEELLGHGSMYARVVLPPGSSVGWHTHIHETEPYYILKGYGDFIDNDRSVTKVGPGDRCTILPGQSHSIENNYDTDLEFMALIYKD